MKYRVLLYRFVLSIIALLLFICILKWVADYRSRRSVMAELQSISGVSFRAGPYHYGDFSYDEDAFEVVSESPIPKWLRTIFGDEAFHDITYARMYLNEKSSNIPKTFQLLSKLTKLKELSIVLYRDTPHADTKRKEIICTQKELACLSELKQLEVLLISGIDFRVDGFDCILKNSELKTLRLDSCIVDILSENYNQTETEGKKYFLENLSITRAVFTSDALPCFCSCSRLKNLELGFDGFILRDQYCPSLTELFSKPQFMYQNKIDEILNWYPHLEILSLSGFIQVNDGFLQNLEEVKTLRRVDIYNCPVSKRGIELLRHSNSGLQLVCCPIDSHK